jgi:hypothetical protein
MTRRGNLVMAMPKIAKVEAIDRSTTEESTSQVLGRVDHRC